MPGRVDFQAALHTVIILNLLGGVAYTFGTRINL